MTRKTITTSEGAKREFERLYSLQFGMPERGFPAVADYSNSMYEVYQGFLLAHGLCGPIRYEIQNGTLRLNGTALSCHGMYSTFFACVFWGQSPVYRDEDRMAYEIDVNRNVTQYVDFTFSLDYHNRDERDYFDKRMAEIREAFKPIFEESHAYVVDPEEDSFDNHVQEKNGYLCFMRLPMMHGELTEALKTCDLLERVKRA